MFWVMLINMIFYMPTIALSITVGYSTLKSKGYDIVTDYPPIRVWGTIGFIVALWTVSLLHLEVTAGQFMWLPRPHFPGNLLLHLAKVSSVRKNTA